MRLAINIDHVATLRNARGGKEPNPIEAAKICEEAGAEGIVCHLREDRRHITDDDVYLLRRTVRTKLDLEMAATDEIVRIALDVKPELATLVPERRQELTTEGGLDVKARRSYLADVIKEMHAKNIAVSLFVNPLPEHIEISKEIGADFIEIHTGEYAEATTEKQQREELVRVQRAARLGKSLGLGVNAGHGLNYINIPPIAAIGDIDEVSIGHAIISHAMFVGLDRAVREMLDLVQGK